MTNPAAGERLRSPSGEPVPEKPAIVVAEHAGFCFGVERAVRMAREAAQGRRVFSLGPLIHNNQAVEQLRRAGVEPVARVEDAQGGLLVIRSHGVPPEVLQRARELGVELVDATCPFVRRVQERARRLREQGYEVVIVGEKEHPEVLGILGHVRGRAFVVERPEEVAQLPPLGRVGLVAQTTQTRENFRAVAQALKRRCAEVFVCDTLCNATVLRQSAAEELSKKADVMLIVGGRHSGNTRRLAEVARRHCPATYHIETAEEIDRRWLDGARIVGVSAGASTPEDVIAGVVARLNELCGGR